jgi:hypothetical protein
MVTWTWTNVTNGLGWPVAFVVAIVVCILWAQGSLPKEWALGTLALCAVRL